MARELRHPVDDLKAFLRERGRDGAETQLFTADDTLRLQLLHGVGEKFDGLSISSSVSCNVEINDAHANKGEAIAALAAYLDLPMAQTMAIGDGLNDRSMIEMTGVGVAMQNACPELLALADEVTAGCDEDGAAIAIERHCVPEGSAKTMVDCHIHMILDGVWWKDAIARHSGGVQEQAVR